MAPEVIHGPDYGTKVDIFSAGIILYILIAGVPPFPGKTEDDVLRKNIKGQIYFPEKYWKNISPEAIDLVLKMTDSKPSTRLSAASCLKHPWFNMHHEHIIPVTRLVKPNQKLPMPKPGRKISSVLMRKMNVISTNFRSLQP